MHRIYAIAVQFLIVLTSFVSSDNNTQTIQSVQSTSTPTVKMNNTFKANANDHIQYAIRNGFVPSKGVNLGGWLIAEKWMTNNEPIWAGLSDEDANRGEYTAMTKTYPKELAVQRFQKHHANFITERDIADIANAGLNTVRVPVGYWIAGFDNHDVGMHNEWKAYAPNTIQYLDVLIRNWGRKYNVAVMISLHGAKGSQNGMDHSSPTVKGRAFWWNYPENVLSTLDSVVFLAERYKNEPAFLGIGLLNEPGGDGAKNEILMKYYQDAYQRIRIEKRIDCILSIAPILWEQNLHTFQNFMRPPAFRNVWIEWHRYFVWGHESASDEELIGPSMEKFKSDLSAWNGNPMFIGEWSFATAGKFLNNEAGFRQFAARQVDTLNGARGGWTFWSWKISGDENGRNAWSLRNMIWNGIARFK